jgi:hypothetical protein
LFCILLIIRFDKFIFSGSNVYSQKYYNSEIVKAEIRNIQNSFTFARQWCAYRFCWLSLNRESGENPGQSRCCKFLYFSDHLRHCPPELDGKAFEKGNKSEDLPLLDYSTLSGKRRRIKPDLFYSSFFFPQVLDLLITNFSK